MYLSGLLLHIAGLSCWWWLLLAMLVPLLLGLLLGYLLWYHYRRRYHDLEVENKAQHDKYTKMESDYFGLKYQFDEMQKDNAGLKSSLLNAEADISILKYKLSVAEAGKAQEQEKGPDPGIAMKAGLAKKEVEDTGGTQSLGAFFHENDLQIIEGIGPKMEQVLNDIGVHNWRDLAKADPNAIAEKMQEINPKYRINDPSTWPAQARLAVDGKWDELAAYQKTLDTGRTALGEGETPAKIEKRAMVILGFSDNPEDLKIIEGIGPKIEQLLKDAGIKTWKDLSNASVERIQEILEQAGDRYRLANPGTWPQQAALAVAKRWKELRDYQDNLKGGIDQNS